MTQTATEIINLVCKGNKKTSNNKKTQHKFNDKMPYKMQLGQVNALKNHSITTADRFMANSFLLFLVAMRLTTKPTINVIAAAIRKDAASPYFNHS